jgi:hypothetical protein
VVKAHKRPKPEEFIVKKDLFPAELIKFRVFQVKALAVLAVQYRVKYDR